jgi:N-acetylglucosamine-6-phosphate deacetylase
MPAKNEKLRIIHGRLVMADHVIPDGSILIEEGRILAVAPGETEWTEAETLDAAGAYVAPGFIDIHVHGGGGHDFMDGTLDAFQQIARLHARHGTTAMLPTTLTADTQGILDTIDVYEDAKDRMTDGARFLGLHLEGPYFAMSQRGAQDPRHIRDPDPAEYLRILGHTDAIRRWSIAPERQGAMPFGRLLTQRGILPSMAHTDAVYEEALEALRNGYTLLTHFYSAMSGVTRRNAYRYAGVIEAGYLHDELDVEIIADGVHLPAPLLKLICKIKGPDRIALITDAMRGAGMPEGPSILGNRSDGLPVIIEDGVAKLPDRSSFAGSVATADRLVRTMIHMAGCTLPEAVRMITATPARILGVEDRIGHLKPGYDADIVLFDQDIQIQETILLGRRLTRHGSIS